MNLFQRTLPALLIFCALAGLGVALHIWGQLALNHVRMAAQQAQQERQSTAAELNQLQHHLPQIKRDLEDYELAQMRGTWAAENRLRFSEGLARLAQDLGLQSLEYGVAPRGIFVASDPQDPTRGQWLHSAIEIQAGALHEEQLLRFIEGFPFLLGGAPVLQECSVSPPQQNPAESGNLMMRCKGMLYSFLGAARPEIKASTPKAMGR